MVWEEATGKEEEELIARVYERRLSIAKAAPALSPGLGIFRLDPL